MIRSSWRPLFPFLLLALVACSDERTNVIIVEDIRDNLDQAEKLVQTLDTQTPLVLIEARMVEASTSFARADAGRFPGDGDA